ncbi:MAG: response regulator [Thiohalocapsa sp.]|nr:response regulator [Thiohalocapsa sp.]
MALLLRNRHLRRAIEQDKGRGAPPADLASLEAEVRERTAALRRARDDAEAASHAKSEFLATMSHEIRTPLNAVIGMTHLALNGEMPARTRGYVGKAHKSAKTLLAIVNDILDISKIEAGKMTLESAPFRLEDVMERLADTIALKAEEKGLELLFDSDLDVPTALIGDPLRLGQVLINLGNNAVKFTDEGEIVVQVRRIAGQASDVELQFSISDTGIGLSDAQQAELFQAFSQADSSITRRFGGTGLGLAISKHLTEMMGGRIWVESTPDAGSVFHFTARFQAQAAEFPVATPDTVGEKRRVLVVDDNETARRIHAMIAESVGLRVDSAVDGAAAIDAVIAAEREGDPYHLVLMDWRMPGIDGLTAARAISTEETLAQKPRVVVISAYGHEEVADATSDLAIAGCLTKPITAAAVLDALDSPAQSAGPDSMMPIIRQQPDPTDVEQVRHAHLLVVEDHAINQEFMVEILSAHGAYADVAANGREAIDKASSGAYDAVLMDIQLPIMDGYEAARAMRDKPALAEIPIIAMTANAMPRDRERAADAGINDFVTKPIDVRALFATLAQWIGPDGWTAPMRPPVLSSTLEPDGRFRSSLHPLPSAAAPAREQTVLYRSMLTRFRTQYLDFPEQFQKAGDDGGPDSQKQLARGLKGVADNLGASRVARAAEQLETACTQDARPERVERLLERITAELHRFAGNLEEAERCDESGDPVPTATPAMSASDFHQARLLAGQLQRLLEDNDAEALSAAAALADLLGRERDLGKSARTCSERVQRFEFASAQKALASIIAELERLQA